MNKSQMLAKKFILFFTIYFLLFTVFIGCSSHSQEVRPPAVSGTFYPGNRAELENMTKEFLLNVDKGFAIARDERLIGLIVPHAGYIYSGQVAAYSYKVLQNLSHKLDGITVVLLGSSHWVLFDGASVYPKGSWETPLGKVSIDEEITKILMKKSRVFKPYLPAHEKEHSLEVQLPFLQMILKNFKIVPIIYGKIFNDDFDIAVEILFSLAKEKHVIIIASSDMSHYHPYAMACLIDGKTLRNIEELNHSGLQEDVNKGLCELCGSVPVLTLMKIAKKMNAKVKILKYANSGDVGTGDKDRVVGYCAVAFYCKGAQNPVQKSDSLKSQKSPKGSFELKGVKMLNKQQQERLLKIARQTLEEYIRKGKILEFKETDPALMEKCGAFVTLTKKGCLRGCIGYIQAILPLYETVSKMAIEASTGDPRFPKVTPEELKDIHIEISVLGPLKEIKDVNEIEVGKHGIYIRKGYSSGLLLPQVATSYGWDKWQFLDQTCLKAGLPAGAWGDKDTQIFIFSAEVFAEGENL